MIMLHLFRHKIHCVRSILHPFVIQCGRKMAFKSHTHTATQQKVFHIFAMAAEKIPSIQSNEVFLSHSNSAHRNKTLRNVIQLLVYKPFGLEPRMKLVNTYNYYHATLSYKMHAVGHMDEVYNIVWKFSWCFQPAKQPLHCSRQTRNY